MPGRRIAFVVWETSKLPEGWYAPQRKAERYWVPCTC
jgi:hypothetical protein